MNLRPLAVAVLAATILVACGRDEPAAPADDQATDATAQPVAPAQAPVGTPLSNQGTTPASDAAEAQSRPAAGFGPRRPAGGVGVPECDSFLIRYERCMRRVPEEARGGMQQALETWRATWGTMTAAPGAASTLVQACENARAEARQQFLSYGCEL